MLSHAGDKNTFMENSNDWAFPSEMRPRSEDLRFDLDAALDSMVLLRAEIPEDAFTASILGTERAGNSVVIRDDGLVLTIGYLVTEASAIWLTTNRGKVVAGDPLAYDQPTGFGLVQALGALGVPALARGTAASCRVGDNVVVAGHGGRAHALKASVFAKREFAGYWEYVLDEAVFTVPAHPQWGGAALLGGDGRLLGIGSLLVEEKLEGETVQGNMIVPIDLLEPILEDMLRLGRASRPPRPWLGLYATGVGRHVAVAGVAERAPATLAGVKVGDIVTEVAGERVSGLADLFRRIWRLGDAGTEVPLTIARKGDVLHLMVRSADRNDFLRKRSVH
ncbi:MAG TPA: S1C family serine protease [Burkholderiales bacterium]|jgi:S1-C subfamily serine protease|nr:S1C family serine protease [Burkholderiales bacterium]